MAGALNGRIGLVTGGESGIGAACAEALAKAGAAIGIVYFEDARLADTIAASVMAAGVKAITVRADVGDEDDVQAAFAKVSEALGPPDLLVNSAGLNMSGINVADRELAQWNRLLRTDLTGAFLTSRQLVRGLRNTKRPGRIVNISSIHGRDVRAGGADYCSAKAGLENLTRTMAIECAGIGVTVNAIAPGMILTPMNKRAEDDADYRSRLAHNIPAGRAGRPDEVADLAVYLCSDAAAYITGAVMTIDGGLSLEAALGA